MRTKHFRQSVSGVSARIAVASAVLGIGAVVGVPVYNTTHRMLESTRMDVAAKRAFAHKIMVDGAREIQSCKADSACIERVTTAIEIAFEQVHRAEDNVDPMGPIHNGLIAGIGVSAFAGLIVGDILVAKKRKKNLESAGETV